MLEKMAMGKILLYYTYTAIADPLVIQTWQKELCAQLHLTGRIIIAHEGINGTVGGSEEAVQQYQEAMLNHPLFHDLDFKVNDGGAHYFPRMKIVIKEEIVRLGIDPTIVSAADAGTYLTPQEAHDLISQKKDSLLLFDARNAYESAIGTFESAVTPPIENFRELPAYIDSHSELFKDKEVIMFCTGGVRCERATAYLKTKKVAQKVYHIKGGICKYVEEYPDGYFKGSNYVFDGRVTIPINSTIIGKCLFCSTPHNACSNCVNTKCNARIISCDTCAGEYYNTCSKRCADLVITKQVTVRTIPTHVASN